MAINLYIYILCGFYVLATEFQTLLRQKSRFIFKAKPMEGTTQDRHKMVKTQFKNGHYARQWWPTPLSPAFLNLEQADLCEWGQHGLQIKFQDIQCYKEKNPVSRKRQNKKLTSQPTLDLKESMGPYMMALAFNPSIWETEAGCSFKVSPGHIVRLS